MSTSRPRRMRAFLVGLALLALAAAPAAIYQALAVVESLVALPVGLSVLIGGKSIILIFEATIRAVQGDRSDTMMTGAPWFYALMLAQSALLAGILAWRRRRTGRILEPISLILLLLVACNAALAVDWPWWGT